MRPATALAPLAGDDAPGDRKAVCKQIWEVFS